jgi:hypothetical protein
LYLPDSPDKTIITTERQPATAGAANVGDRFALPLISNDVPLDVAVVEQD